MPDPAGLPDDLDDLMKAFGVGPGKGAAAGGPDAAGVPGAPAKAPQTGARKPELEALEGKAAAEPKASLEMLKDVTLNLRVEIGRTRMFVQDILKLGEGSIVELDRLTGDPLDLYVNGRLVARGEVLVINESFALRITEVLHAVAPEPKKA